MWTRCLDVARALCQNARNTFLVSSEHFLALYLLKTYAKELSFSVLSRYQYLKMVLYCPSIIVLHFYYVLNGKFSFSTNGSFLGILNCDNSFQCCSHALRHMIDAIFFLDYNIRTIFIYCCHSIKRASGLDSDCQNSD